MSLTDWSALGRSQAGILVAATLLLGVAVTSGQTAPRSPRKILPTGCLEQYEDPADENFSNRGPAVPPTAIHLVGPTQRSEWNLSGALYDNAW